MTARIVLTGCTVGTTNKWEMGSAAGTLGAALAWRTEGLPLAVVGHSVLGAQDWAATSKRQLKREGARQAHGRVRAAMVCQ